MHVRPTAVLVGDENHALAADSRSLLATPKSPRPSHRPELYTTVLLHVLMPVGGWASGSVPRVGGIA